MDHRALLIAKYYQEVFDIPDTEFIENFSLLYDIIPGSVGYDEITLHVLISQSISISIVISDAGGLENFSNQLDEARDALDEHTLVMKSMLDQMIALKAAGLLTKYKLG